MDENKSIEKLYMGKLNPMEEIYQAIERQNPSFKTLMKKAETIETMLEKKVDSEILEEYSDIHTKIQHIVSKSSFQYGLNLGIQFMRDL